MRMVNGICFFVSHIQRLALYVFVGKKSIYYFYFLLFITVTIISCLNVSLSSCLYFCSLCAFLPSVYFCLSVRSFTSIRNLLVHFICDFYNHYKIKIKSCNLLGKVKFLTKHKLLEKVDCCF